MSLDPTRFRTLCAIFERAAELPRGDRDAFLAEACGGDADLREDVIAMLRGVDVDEFLAPPYGRTIPAPALALGDTVAGKYLLLRVVGEGGMGVVYEAEQASPQRRVALKTLRAGVTSPGMLRRLELEVEALGRLRHPGIAAVHDAGFLDPHASAPAVPFFVMEYVEGSVDLVHYAQREQLDTKDIVRLALDVCDAVAHGHRNGVVHRDLKPANVLVGADGVAKVIDFGVARIAREGEEGDARTRLTTSGEIVGTLSWMAPEQFLADSAAVDTRTDVHGLGLLLYRLLYGRGPYALEGMSWTKIAETVRTAAPIDPRTLPVDRPSDLAWVVLRALEKEPARRYQSASELSADLRRFLAGLPVEAGPPSVLYHARKLIRRHRLAFGVAGAVALALGLGAAIALHGLVEAARESEKFRGINAVLTKMLDGVQRVGNEVRAADLLDAVAAQLDAEHGQRPEVEAPLRLILARSHLSLGEPARAEAQARRALELCEGFASEGDPGRLEGAALLSWALRNTGRRDEAYELLVPYADLARRADPSSGDGQPIEVLVELGLALRFQVRFDEAEAVLRDAAARARTALGPVHPTTISAETGYAQALLDIGRAEDALTLGKEVTGRVEEERGGRNTRAWREIQGVLGRALMTLGRHAEAETVLRGRLLAESAARGPTHPRTLSARNDLAELYLHSGRAGEARRLLEETLAERYTETGVPHATLGAAHDDAALAREALADAASLLEEAGGPARGEDPAAGLQAELVRESELRAAVDDLARRLGQDDPQTLAATFALGEYLRLQGRYAEAEPLLVDLLERQRRALGAPHADLCATLEELGVLLQMSRRFERALEAFDEDRRGCAELYGHDDARTARADMHYMVTLSQAGGLSEAVGPYADALDRFRAAEPESPSLLVACLNLFQMHRLNGDAERAEEVLREACMHADLHVPADHPLRSEAYRSLGELLRLSRRAQEALPWLVRARGAVEESPGVSSAKRGEAHLAHARCLRDLGRTEEALAELSSVHAAEELRLGKGHRGLRPIAEDIAEVLGALGREEEADAWRGAAGG